MVRRLPPPAASDVTGTLRVGTNRERLGLILRRDDLTDAEDAALLAAGDGLAGAVRLGLRHPEPDVRAATASFAGAAGSLAMTGEVVPLLADGDERVRSAAAGALHAFADRADAVARGDVPGEPGRRAFVAALADGARAGGPRAQRLCGWLAAGGRADDGELRDLLRDSACEPALARALTTDRHPGTVRLLLELLAARRPPRAARLAAGRSDPAFLFALLRTVTDGGAARVPGLPPLPWLAEPGAVLAGLPPALQPAVCELAERGCESGSALRAVRLWLLTRGGAAGRRAAEPALRELPANRRAALLSDAAASDDPAVAAWAAELLATHRVPDWPRRLAALARRPEPAVRAAAGRALRAAAGSLSPTR